MKTKKTKQRLFKSNYEKTISYLVFNYDLLSENINNVCLIQQADFFKNNLNF